MRTKLNDGSENMVKENKFQTYYWGRGASACVAVQIVPGNRAKVFIGNGKSLEKGEFVSMDRGDLRSLSDFFRALDTKHGSDIFTYRIEDDPHDEVFMHRLNLDIFEMEEEVP